MEADDLAAWLDRLTFADLATDEVTARVIDAVRPMGRPARAGGSTAGRRA